MLMGPSCRALPWHARWQTLHAQAQLARSSVAAVSQVAQGQAVHCRAERSEAHAKGGRLEQQGALCAQARRRAAQAVPVPVQVRHAAPVSQLLHGAVRLRPACC